MLVVVAVRLGEEAFLSVVFIGGGKTLEQTNYNLPLHKFCATAAKPAGNPVFNA